MCKQYSIEMPAPGAKLRLWLTAALVFERRLVTAQSFPHYFPRYAQFTADRLDRFTLRTRKPPYL